MSYNNVSKYKSEDKVQAAVYFGQQTECVILILTNKIVQLLTDSTNVMKKIDMD